MILKRIKILVLILLLGLLISGCAPKVTNNPPSGDVTKAKALVADLRNTILTIHDYKGIGIPGIVDTPFSNLSKEIQEKIVPDLSETMDRIGFILNCTSQIEEEGTYIFEYPEISYILEITLTLQQAPNTYSLTFKGYKNNNKIDEGSFTINFGDDDFPDSGTLNVAMGTTDGTLNINGNFTATKLENSKTIDVLTITGSLTSEYMNINLEDLKVDMGEWYDNPNNIYRNYLEKITLSGKITTTTAQAEGNLNIEAAFIEYPNGNTDNPLKNISFIGTFREMKNESPTGAYFTGQITGEYLNPDSYDPYKPYGPNNFPKWKANFTGHIEAPQRPKIDANLRILHDTYQIYKITVGYERTNPDNTKVWLKTLQIPLSRFNESTQKLEVYLINQDNLTVEFTVDGTKSGDDVFSGVIKNNMGTKLADLYLLSGVPTVKYVDNYVESIF